MVFTRKGATPLTFDPTDFQLFAGLPVPDPITFVVSPQWLNRPNLYPRQVTLLKVIFLRVDLLTEYDLEVIDGWETSFRSTGNNGITPGIIGRMRYLRENGHHYFREVLLVMGRRGSKGFISSLAMAYVLWRYMSKGNPQGFYGVDRDKQLACFIYAGKKEQARENLWRDLINVITGGPCFAKYISSPMKESLSVYAPHDLIRMKRLQDRGVHTAADIATFTIQPKEATMMSGRGPASFMQGYDEMAHQVTAAGASRSAEEIYCLDPHVRVLTADLTWRKIKDLQLGDKLVGFDEYPRASGEQRKLREAIVEGKWKTYGKALRLHFEDGSSVVCSPNHRWFKVSADCNNGKWTTAGKVERKGSAGNPQPLRVGDYIRHIVDPWEVDDSRAGGYLAGIFDGEGWSSSPSTSAFKVGFSQNPGVVQDTTLRYLKEFGFEPYTWRMWEGRTTECQTFELRGLADCLRFLGQFRPERLLAKSQGLWENKTPRGYTKHKRITEIEELPEQELIDIQTSTATFIAEGLISHNSAATPALDQFKKDAFIIEPSSPWQQIGQFYSNWLNSLAIEDGQPLYPEMMMLQIASWEIYYDWDHSHELDLFPPEFLGDLNEYVEDPHPKLPRLKLAIQEYDEGMRKLEKSNPETFAVERRSQWQATIDAYLNPERIAEMFGPWNGEKLQMHTEGNLTLFYKGHADPSLANANFGVAIAHPEKDEDGILHCVFDYIYHYAPSDFPDNIIDYPQIDDDLWRLIQGFKPDEFTFDQWNSANSIARLNRRVYDARFPKRVEVFEKTATAAHNWERAENFKIALNQRWIHAPAYEQAQMELLYLQLKNGKVEKQDAGPVQTKDVADCLMEVVWTILGEQVRSWTHGALSNFEPRGSLQGGFDPYAREADRPETIQQLASLGTRNARTTALRGGAGNPARNPMANRKRRF
jgi:hypothetical protein